MGSSQLGHGGLCVVMLPAGPEGDRILDVVRTWTGNWLLTPALWVRAEDVPLEAVGPPEIHARIVGRSPTGGSAEADVELFWALGERHHPRVRLLALQMKQDADLQEETAKAITQLDSYLKQAMPLDPEQDPTRNREMGDFFTEFLRINLIVDAAEMEGVDPHTVFRYDWDANVVASPEDRSEPYSSDAPPLEPVEMNAPGTPVAPGLIPRTDRYFGWVVAQLATAAGLWSGINETIYDLMKGKAGKAHEMCIVQRVVVRGIITDGLAIDLAQTALVAAETEDEERVRLLQMALQEHGVESIADADVAERVATLVDEVLKGFRSEGVGYQEFGNIPKYEPPEESIWRALRRYFSKGWKATTRIPAVLADLVLQRASDRLTVAEGETIVSGPLTWNAGVPRIDDGIFQLPEVAAPSSSGLRTSPQLWRDLQELLFAAVDGNPHITVGQELLTSRNSGKRVVFPTRTNILPDPDGAWVLDERSSLRLEGGNTLEWLDQQRAEQSLTTLAESHDARRTQLDALQLELREADKVHDGHLERLLDLEFQLKDAQLQEQDYRTWLDELLNVRQEEAGADA